MSILETITCFICLILLCESQFVSPSSKQQQIQFTPKEFNSCFSQLSGPVEELCPSIELLHAFNIESFYGVITELVKRPYFRYYQTNLTRSCRFWTPSEQCTMPDCQLECCEDTEVPAYQIHSLCSQDMPIYNLGAINQTITPAKAEEISQWDLLSADICFEDQIGLLEDQLSSFYDLQSNREQYTAYTGPDAHRVWKSIYKENCFLPPGMNTSYKLNRIFTESSLAELCIEKRAFYRLISGLHASISLHLCEYYKYSCGAVYGKDEWRVNVNEFYHRFNPSSTDQQGPIWLKNIYFTFLVELYALSQAESDLKEAVFYTGNTVDDIDIQNKVSKILALLKTVDLSFDQKRLFFAEIEHVTSIRDAFANITRIIDCVTCQRCRLWGKLQTRAIATSLKILFSSHLSSNGNSHIRGGLLSNLARGEIVALFNGIAQLSKSIYFIESHRHLYN
ncbi:ERO1-like protein beta [Oopsacas minuta]|uniref:ERO1-like protein beta n=1 Tax=Oopsacas minuta TaxID=111878 RepID=A0AAV7KLB5_9METZ|nr:ERO1-like protein beta [Oopsacas minuta]